MAGETCNKNLPQLPFARFVDSASANWLSFFGSFNNRISNSPSSSSSSSGTASFPVLFADAPILTFPFQQQQNCLSKPSAAMCSRFPSSAQIDGLSSSSKGGPAFVGQVFSMCDPSGTGLMAVTTHFDVPFLSKRIPEWIRKMLGKVTNNGKDGPLFRFFMDLSDAVAYVKRLNIPTGMVGACRLDIAYEHFKEKPDMFQFVPNGKQVKAANKLLRTISKNNRKRRLKGVPVFTAKNLNIAIATTDGIKWYTPYFFDKGLLDNILEASIDQHFDTLIQNRHMQRHRDVNDDNLAAEAVEENGESLFEPPEVQQVLDEMGLPGIPWSVISKAAEIQLLDSVDKVLLGNKWLRKATGIQPKLPYLVDSFEERTEASYLKVASTVAKSEAPDVNIQHELPVSGPDVKSNHIRYNDQGQPTKNKDFRIPLMDWFSSRWSEWPWEEQESDKQIKLNSRSTNQSEESINQAPPNPLLPKITMVGISTGEAGQMSKASLKKTMEDLTRELELTGQGISQVNEDKDPLFVANVGDYSRITKSSST